MLKVKNTNDIRKVITEEIDLLRKDNSNPAKANAIANLIGKLLQSVKLDIAVHRYVSKSKIKDLSIPLFDQTESKQSREAERKEEKEEEEEEEEEEPAIEDPQELKESPGTGEIMEEAKPGEELTGEERTKKSLDDATKLIKRETEKLEIKKKDWKKCSKCNRRPVAPWNTKGICSTCQKRRKTNRPYVRKNVVI